MIGVVAAITLSSVIEHYQKYATAAKVHKFYNQINIALNYAIAEHGDARHWFPEPQMWSYEQNLAWLNLYFLPYIKTYKNVDKCYNVGYGYRGVCVYMNTGGMFVFYNDTNGMDFFYFVNGKPERTVKNLFSFQINKAAYNEAYASGYKFNNLKASIEPYTVNWSGIYEELYTASLGCKIGLGAKPYYCAKILQLNNWKFPKDYPW